MAEWTPRHQIGVGYLNLSSHTKKLVQDVLDSNRLSYGPMSRSFESTVANIHGCKYGVVSNSGTSALLVALAALAELRGWNPGDEVIVPAVTFVATANVVLQLGLKPVFVDVDAYTYNIDCDLIPGAISARTRCILPVHLCGLPAAMDRITRIAADHGLDVVEDSCETMFVDVAGKPVGSHGAIGCFSTYASHLLVTGVGGMSVTNDPELAQIMRSLCNHGRHPSYLAIDDDRGRSAAELEGIVDTRFLFERIGFSYRITEMEAAIGIGSLDERDMVVAERRRNAAALTDGLAHLAARGLVRTPTIPPGSEHAFMIYPLVLDERVNRHELTTYLELANIETRPLFPLVNQPVYRRLFGDLVAGLPVAGMLNRQGFYIGCHQGMSDQETSYVVRVIDSFFRDRGI